MLYNSYNEGGKQMGILSNCSKIKERNQRRRTYFYEKGIERNVEERAVGAVRSEFNCGRSGRMRFRKNNGGDSSNDDGGADK